MFADKYGEDTKVVFTYIDCGIEYGWLKDSYAAAFYDKEMNRVVIDERNNKSDEEIDKWADSEYNS